jgi:hypothetical protein
MKYIVMPVNQLTDFCHSQKNKADKCPDCTYECDNNCKHCLEKIHFENPDKRCYDCDNIIHCYTCSYIYKYASEIHYLLQKHPLTTFTEFSILSLGCGSCADLFGINNFLTEQKRVIPIIYRGIDCNPKWKSTQDEIKEIFPDYKISFTQSDVFDYLDSITDDFVLPNILILQYLLNELIKNNDVEKMNEFVKDLVAKIISKMPDNSIIIINDINHYTARGWFDKLHAEINKSKNASFIDYRFTEPTANPVKITQHTNDVLLFSVPINISANYDVKNPCSSAQAIITIKNKV